MQATDDTETIPGPPDASDEREQLSMFARCGQLALPGASAQLGLDGAAYALDPIEASATAEASHDVLHTQQALSGGNRLPRGGFHKWPLSG